MPAVIEPQLQLQPGLGLVVLCAAPSCSNKAAAALCFSASGALLCHLLVGCSPKMSQQNATCLTCNSCLTVCTAALTAGSNPIGPTGAHIPNAFGVEETMCQAGAQGRLGAVQAVSCTLCPVLPAPCYGSSDV